MIPLLGVPGDSGPGQSMLLGTVTTASASAIRVTLDGASADTAAVVPGSLNFPLLQPGAVNARVLGVRVGARFYVLQCLSSGGVLERPVFRGVRGGGLGNTLNIPIAYTSVSDSHSGWATDRYTVKVAGYYEVGQQAKQSTAVGPSHLILKNGAAILTSGNMQSAAFASTVIDGLVPLSVNDVILCQPNATYTTVSDAPADNNYLNLIWQRPL